MLINYNIILEVRYNNIHATSVKVTIQAPDLQTYRYIKIRKSANAQVLKLISRAGRLGFAVLRLWLRLRLFIGQDLQSWALSVFLNFFTNTNFFFAVFIKLITYFCTSPI